MSETQALEFVEQEPLHADINVSIHVRRSNEVTKLLPALIKAQLEFEPIVKDAENEAYKRGQKVSKYATLDGVVSATLPHLNKHGLTILQHLQSDNKSRELIITTSLYHESGQFFESDLTMPSIGQNSRFDPQTVASASTYGRRIAWLAITGAAPADDDGNAAAGVGSREAAQAVAKDKIASAAKAGSKTAQKALERGEAAFNEDAQLVYVYPQAHNGNYAEWLNIRAYLFKHQDQEEALRLLFSTHKAKKTQDDTALVPREKMPNLLEVLAGEYGITITELKAP